MVSGGGLPASRRGVLDAGHFLACALESYSESEVGHKVVNLCASQRIDGPCVAIWESHRGLRALKQPSIDRTD